jgi:hypothetical protein
MQGAAMPIRSLFLFAALTSAATLTVTPPFISDCTNGLATATINWSGATGLVQIVVGKLPGIVMTGLLGASGSAVTGPWVTDGLPFYLIDQAGNIEASATAQVSCGSTPRTIDQGLSGGSYFPLAFGNTWVYKYNSRLVTASYITRSITGTQTIAGQNYFVLTETSGSPPFTVALLRAASDGVIWQNTSSGDVVYLDPNASGSQKTAYSGPLGAFTDAITTTAVQFSLVKTTSIFVRGLGFANSQSTMLTGSSGGFTDGLDLVDVRIDGVHLVVPAPKISLSIENATFDLTNKLAPNCAVPCYFAACGLAPSADPPGTYRPCVQARIDTNTALNGYTVLVQLLDPKGTAVFQNFIQVGTTSSLNYVRLPLYTAVSTTTQFTLLPPGDYTLAGNILNASVPQATSSITIHIH